MGVPCRNDYLATLDQLPAACHSIINGIVRVYRDNNITTGRREIGYIVEIIDYMW
jgi:hypothetical protein